MTVERNIIASIVKLTKTGLVDRQLVGLENRIAPIVFDRILDKLAEEGLIKQRGRLIEASSSQRVNMVVESVRLGADLEKVCKFLEWTEFESVAALAFQANGFNVLKNFRFKHVGKRWEIDVLGYKQPLIVCADCKHWLHGWSRAAIVKTVEAQTERTRALADSLPSSNRRARLSEWKHAKLVPIVVSLVPGPFKFYNNVPIVSVLQLPDFIYAMPLEIDSLTHFSKKLLHQDLKLTKFLT